MIKVAPSILSADFGNLQRDIEAICEAGCDLVHVDRYSFDGSKQHFFC